MGWQFGFACRSSDGRLSAEPPKKLLDDHCGTQAEMVDARLGIMGFMRIVRIMGKKLGRHEIPRGVACRCGDGRQSAEPPNRSDLSDMSDLSDLSDQNACCSQRLA